MTTQQILQGVHDWTNGKIVYDISVAHPDGQGNPTKYATLAAALGTNGANIPDTIRKGGMSIKFIQSSDNKYVQYRLMNQNWSTTISDWQGVDDEPTAGSDNLVKSRGVLKTNNIIFVNNGIGNGININNFIKELYIDDSLSESVLFFRNFRYRETYSAYDITISDNNELYNQRISTEYNGEIISLNDGKIKMILKNLSFLKGDVANKNTDNTKFIINNSVALNKINHPSISLLDTDNAVAELERANDIITKKLDKYDKFVIISEEFENFENKLINTDGSLSNSNSYKVTPIIYCKKGQIVKYNAYTDNNTLAVAFYKNNEFVKGQANSRVGVLPLEYTVPDDGYVRICCANAYIQDAYVEIVNKDYTYNTIFDINNAIKLQRVIGNIVPKFELGNIINATPSYIASRKRVRTPKDYPLLLKVGDKIGLSSYDGYMYSAWYTTDGGTTYNLLANQTADITISVDGIYSILIKRDVDSDLNSVDELASLFFVKAIEENVEVEKLNNTVYDALYTDFPDKEIELVNKVLSDKDSNTVTFGLIADTHNSGRAFERTAKQGYYLSKFSELVGASFMVHLGDVINGGESTRQGNIHYLVEYWRESHRTYIPSFYTLAHHEQYGLNGAFQVPTSATPEECLGIYGFLNKYQNVTWNSDKSCWYIDVDGIRFIGLNSSSDGSVGFSSDVVNFLGSALNNCNTPVICMSHIGCNGSMNYGNPRRSNEIQSALSNYQNGVLAYFMGHNHWDMIWKVSGMPFLYWSTCCSKASKLDFTYKFAPTIGVPEDYTRVVGEYSEFCMDIVNVHKDTGVIKSFRFGAGYDRIAHNGLSVAVGNTLTLVPTIDGTIEWDIYDSTSGYIKDAQEQTATLNITRDVATINNGVVSALSAGISIAVAFNGTAKEFFYITVS